MNTVIFDIGGVIVSWDEVRLAQEFHPDKRIQQSILNDIFGTQAWRDYDQGLLNDEEAVTAFVRESALNLQQAGNLIHYCQQSLTVNRETEKLIKELSPNYHLYSLSNTPESFMTYINANFPVMNYFKARIYSSALKIAKPMPEIYQYLIEHYDLNPADCIFLDDRQENIDAARDAGMHGIVFESAAQCRNDLSKLIRIGE